VSVVLPRQTLPQQHQAQWQEYGCEEHHSHTQRTDEESIILQLTSEKETGVQDVAPRLSPPLQVSQIHAAYLMHPVGDHPCQSFRYSCSSRVALQGVSTDRKEPGLAALSLIVASQLRRHGPRSGGVIVVTPSPLGHHLGFNTRIWFMSPTTLCCVDET
jgi:hypothetical protein